MGSQRVRHNWATNTSLTVGIPTFTVGMYFTAQTIKFHVNPVFKHNCLVQALKRQDGFCRRGVPRLDPPAFQASCPEVVTNSQVRRRALCSQGSQIITREAEPPVGKFSNAETAV